MKQAEDVANKEAIERVVETMEEQAWAGDPPKKGVAPPNKALTVRTRLRAGGGSDDAWVGI
jgi:hypothetical protein